MLSFLDFPIPVTTIVPPFAPSYLRLRRILFRVNFTNVRSVCLHTCIPINLRIKALGRELPQWTVKQAYKPVLDSRHEILLRPIHPPSPRCHSTETTSITIATQPCYHSPPLTYFMTQLGVKQKIHTAKTDIQNTSHFPGHLNRHTHPSARNTELLQTCLIT